MEMNHFKYGCASISREKHQIKILKAVEVSVIGIVRRQRVPFETSRALGIHQTKAHSQKTGTADHHD